MFIILKINYCKQANSVVEIYTIYTTKMVHLISFCETKQLEVGIRKLSKIFTLKS